MTWLIEEWFDPDQYLPVASAILAAFPGYHYYLPQILIFAINSECCGK